MLISKAYVRFVEDESFLTHGDWGALGPMGLISTSSHSLIINLPRILHVSKIMISENSIRILCPQPFPLLHLSYCDIPEVNPIS